MSQVKVQSDRQVRIPAQIFIKYRLRQGDILEVHDAGNGIVFIPKNGRQKLTKDHFFELIERTWARNRNIDSKALDRVINRAVRKVRAEERKAMGR
jgi:bifunctional DNA-binding transcriptional regulator/antitoxin component of YhaV-PrlF toxin-antitoxin module